MRYCRARCGLLLALLSVWWPFEAGAADLPTTDQILQIHRENRERLSRLHLQVVHRLETTEAFTRKLHREADVLEERAASDELYFTKFGVYPPSPSTLIAESQRLRHRASTRQILRPMEIFLNGPDHQYRQPPRPFANEQTLAGWTFCGAPVTAETLRSQHRDQIIFSRSSCDGHSAQLWRQGTLGATCAAPDRLDQVVNVSLPPFASALSSSWYRMHPYDLFFSQEPSAYSVVRVEELDGQQLVVVDALVSLGDASEGGIDCRAWLDLKRGALPVKMYSGVWSGGIESMRTRVFDRFPPTDVIVTREVRALENGAYYPTKTMFERSKLDPDEPKPGPNDIEAFLAGEQDFPMSVFYRETWTCTRVEIKTDYPADFFVLPVAPVQTSATDVY